MAFYHIYHINRPLITIDGFVDRGRKLNLNLDSAIQEAMNELDRQTEHHPTMTTTVTTTTNATDDREPEATRVPNRITVTTKRRKTKA